MLDVLSIGELLIDLISEDGKAGLADADRFQLIVGGAPANVAITASALGGSAAAAGSVGMGSLGDRIERHLTELGVDCHLQRAGAPTTVAIVSRSSETPDFMIVRGADRLLEPSDLPNARWLHTSFFALSEDPQRTSVLSAIRDFEGQVSIDANYHPSVWRGEHAYPDLTSLAAHADLLKASRDDCHRLFGPGDPHGWIEQLQDFGFGTIVFTNGAESVFLAAEDEITEFPVPHRNVVDVTGAGDAFTAGVLMARIDGLSWQQAVAAGVEVAGRNVEVVGHVLGPLDRSDIYAATPA